MARPKRKADRRSTARPEAPPPTEESARADAEAVRLGRFLPLGMGLGAAVGLVVGLATHHFGICVPAGIALGILVAGTLPVFGARR